MTFAYFCLGALDLLQQLDTVVSQSDREAYTSWVYGQQISSKLGGGFRGSPAACRGHITMTYTALLILAILRDDFSRLDREALRTHISQLQQPDGRYVSHTNEKLCLRSRFPGERCPL